VIAIVVAAALTSSTDSPGFLFAFGLETLFFWAIFIYRKQITARLVSATTGAAHHVPRMTVVQRGVETGAGAVVVSPPASLPRITLTALQRADVHSGQLDPRLLAALAQIGDEHSWRSRR
jgi:hypothetical protein